MKRKKLKVWLSSSFWVLENLHVLLVRVQLIPKLRNRKCSMIERKERFHAPQTPDNSSSELHPCKEHKKFLQHVQHIVSREFCWIWYSRMKGFKKWAVFHIGEALIYFRHFARSHSVGTWSGFLSKLPISSCLRKYLTYPYCNTAKWDDEQNKEEQWTQLQSFN